MNIPLNEFEQLIDETILQRGFQYFKKGLVTGLDEISPGEYEAIVHGTEQYTVNLTIKNEVVTEFVCTCPYDKGPICKHVVAVIFNLQEAELNLKVKPGKTSKKGDEAAPRKSTKKKTIEEQVDELLCILSHDELKEYIKGRCMKERSFQQLFIANFAYLVNPDSQALYSKQIQAILNTYGDRDGFLGYSESRSAGSAVQELVHRAVQMMESENYQTAMYMACAILEEMVGALEYADDSCGEIGGCIKSALAILNTLAEKSIVETQRVELFNYAINAYKKKLFKGWNWHLDMIELAISLIKKQEETALIHQLIDKILPTGKGYDWEYSKAQQLKLELIRKTESEEKLTLFLEQNIKNPDFRKEVIGKAIKNKEYAKAIALAKTGILLDEKETPGIANDWRKTLLDIYILQQDTENILKMARYLFENSIDCSKKIYFIIKKCVSPDIWKSFVDQLIVDVNSQSRGDNYPLVSQINIWEERWDTLFEQLKKGVSLDRIESSEKYLAKGYSPQLIDLYHASILKFMVRNVGRGYYQTACCYIRRMIKLGGREKANLVIANLRQLYPNRRALMEELRKV